MISMDWLALALFTLYALVGFGIRTAVQIRRTGDSGFRGLSGAPGTAAWWAGVLFAAALATGVLGPVAALLGLPAVPMLDRGWIHAVGVVLASVGIVGTFVTQLAMGDSWRVGVDEGERTALVTSGAFALVRNPFFTATFVTGAGLALIVPNAVAILGWALLLLAIELQVKVVEEPYLRRHHGEPYRTYMTTVGRFVPGIGLARAIR